MKKHKGGFLSEIGAKRVAMRRATGCSLKSTTFSCYLTSLAIEVKIVTFIEEVLNNLLLIPSSVIVKSRSVLSVLFGFPLLRNPICIIPEKRYWRLFPILLN